MKKNIVITILIIVVLGLCTFIVYDKDVFKLKGEKNENNSAKKVVKDKKEITESNGNYVIDAYAGMTSWDFPTEGVTSEEEKSIKVINQANIPKITLKSTNVEIFNKKIYDNYNQVIETIKKGTYDGFAAATTATHINYDYLVQDDIIFIHVSRETINYRGSGYISDDIYYYDIANDKELTKEDIYDKYNISLDDINFMIEQHNTYSGTSAKKISTYDYYVMPTFDYNSFTVYVMQDIDNKFEISVRRNNF